MAVVSKKCFFYLNKRIKEVEKFVDLWLKEEKQENRVLLNFKGLRRLLGKRQRLLAYLAKKNRNKNKDMSLSLKRKDLMIVNMGPQHPSMHGYVIDCEPILGYLHRGMEKIAENRSIIQYLPYVTRWDYLATMFTENIQIPKRASYIRVIMLELSRIASHLERELIYDLFEAATGMRMMHNYFRIGGVAADLPYGWMDKCLDFCDYFLQGVVEYQELITQNPIFLERVEGVGFISGEEAVNWGLSGPMLRASGIQWDLRKIDPYESYNQFDWKVQWQKEGDSLARYLVRVGEMRESIKIIQQAVEKIPGGPYENLEADALRKQRIPNGMILNIDFLLYVRVEAPKGELGIYLVGDDSLFPWRWKIRPPGFINLQILPQLVKKMKLADIMTILGSIDIIMGKLIVEMIIDRVEKEKYPHRYNNVLDIVFKKSHFLRTRKNEGLGTLKIPHELMPNSFHLLIDEINSEARIALSKYGFFGWNLWRQPIGFLVFLISSLAECERLPFDLPEAEEELVAGYQTEYSGIKYGLFYLVST
ncbi:hypothetical protein ACJX0J_000431 [Zea mays]